jgi:predicted nucleic acid-binding protein
VTHGHPNYLLDITVLSNLAHVRRPDLPRTVLGSNVTVTPNIMAELRIGEQAGLVPRCDWTWLTVLTPTAAELATATALQRQLDPGEAECLAVALHRGYRFLSDDFAARRLAEARGLTVSGTIGILLKGIAAGALSLPEADRLLAEMIAHGYRAPVRSLRELTAG